LADKRTAVEVERRIMVLFALLPVARSVGDPEVLLGGLHELFAEALLEVGVLAALLPLVANVLAVLEVLLLGFAESVEVGLEGQRLLVEEVFVGLGLLRVLLLLSWRLTRRRFSSTRWRRISGQRGRATLFLGCTSSICFCSSSLVKWVS